ncbi:kinase-like protein [Pholiota conissans]|uniref:Altered inheritance of mitochondria protein 9, mitochondrial n=1 Tax=Pholiota conissans TaxID=109636 RepID=A0A9P6D6F7_9AGAR|nr:kinase-like protein [Pholiota conissans]
MFCSFARPLQIRINRSLNALKPLNSQTYAVFTSSSLKPSAKEEPVSIEALKVTPRRWLYNNDIQMALRRVEFDVEALGAIAAKAVGAVKCNEIAFIVEGSYNRVFRLRLSNNKTVIARIPFPNAGPQSILTRSEVATMDFLRTRNVPVPKVLAWDATTTNAVGCEYIIMEQCPGSTLEDNDTSRLELYRHIADVVDMMAGLASVRFSQYGSIYYKEDVDELLRERPLYAEGEAEDASSERFRIGPSVERRFYRGGRTGTDIDRGPWKDVQSYLKAAVDCEIEWMRLYSSSPEAKAQLGAWHTPERHIKALQMWFSLAPAVLPPPEYCIPTLSHPDLHVGNIFVTGTDPLSVSGFIDWQGASVSPLFETEIPNIFDDDDESNLKYVAVVPGEHQPIMPDNYDQLTAVEQEEARTEYRRIWPRYLFYKLLKKVGGPLLAVMRLWQMELVKKAVYFSSHCWSDGLPAFEQILMLLSAEYGKLIPVHDDYPICPVVFSEEDEKRHEKEYKVVFGEEILLEPRVKVAIERAGIVMGPDGAVESKDLDAAMRINEDVYAMTVAGKSEAHREAIRRRWPIREGKFVCTMESCR